ncbi:MAG: hypothetical protein ABIJ57_05160 [Pseudomonadota bacterium]
MAIKKTDFPAELFVYIRKEGDIKYFVATDNFEGSEDGDLVAIYERREIKKKVTIHELK